MKTTTKLPWKTQLVMFIIVVLVYDRELRCNEQLKYNTNAYLAIVN